MGKTNPLYAVDETMKILKNKMMMMVMMMMVMKMMKMMKMMKIRRR